MSTKIYSHPDVLLQTHLKQVFDLVDAEHSKHSIFPDLKICLKVCALFHDLGKASHYFQGYLEGTSSKSKLSSHSEISALWGFLILKDYFNASIDTALMAYIAIRNHHGNFGDLADMLSPNLSMDDLSSISQAIDYDYLTDIYHDYFGSGILLNHAIFSDFLESSKRKSLVSHSRSILARLNTKAWIRLNYLFSLLVWADKNSAIFNDDKVSDKPKKWIPLFVDNYKESLSRSESIISNIRDEAYTVMKVGNSITSRILSLNLPTGAGKTISALRAALSIMETDTSCQRIIYCLPFTSVIDQNHKVYESILKLNNIDPSSDIILPHHHLADTIYQDANTEYSTNKAEFMIESWDSELVITTFVQLLQTVFTYRNRAFKRYHRLANSIIILDEVQSINHKYWNLIRDVFLDITLYMNCRVILVTATLPLIFDPTNSEIQEIAIGKDKWFKALNRTVLNTEYIDQMIDVEGLSAIIKADYEDKPRLNRLIILNTVKSSLALYKSLLQTLPESNLMYLSANVVPHQRLCRIEDIRNRKDKGMIIVSTQVVEAGVDIDVDIVYRDIAPLDSILQACGRCNRNGLLAKGVAYLMNVFDGKKPYWSYIYDSTLIDATIKAIAGKSIIHESEFCDISKRYYEFLSEAISTEDSKFITNAVAFLNYERGLCFSRENKKAFHLFDEASLVTVFVELDDVASKLLTEYKKCSNSSINDYEARAYRKAIFKKMSYYMVNVPSKLIKTEAPFYVIDREMIATMYNMQTGFIREPQIEDYIF